MDDVKSEKNKTKSTKWALNTPFSHINICFFSYLWPFVQDLLTDVLVLLQQPLLPFILCVFQLLHKGTHKDTQGQFQADTDDFQAEMDHI